MCPQSLRIRSVVLGCAGALIWGGCAGTSAPADDGEGQGEGEAEPAGPECEDGEARPCFDAEERLSGIGACKAGLSRCQGGIFDACIGQVTPGPESCDGTDEDCDGTADEGLGDTCVPCEGDCHRDGFGANTDRPFAAGEDSQGVKAADGGLVLDTEEIDVSFVWIANTDEGTVSKIEPRAGKEVARYLSALPVAGLPPPLERCRERDGGPGAPPAGNCPSRTAVDLRGDVWVANRAFEGQGSVTKILAAGCPDKDGDGVIRTSHDADGNGMINLADAEEFPGVDDECVALTVPIGKRNAKPRGLAVDPFFPPDHGSVWVGAYDDKEMHRVHGTTGEILVSLPLTIRPYGAVMTASRTLWVTSLRNVEDGIVHIDSATNEVGAVTRIQSSSQCAGGYGIAVDAKGRIWLGGWDCQAVFRFDPADGSWRTYDLQRGHTRGVTVDGAGQVWVAQSHSGHPIEEIGRITSMNADDGGDRREIDLPGAAETIGLGVDADGKIWAVNRGSNNAMRIDPDSGDVLATVPTGDAPYTYSDFTGFGLRTFTAPFGSWWGDVDACPPSGDPDWERLNWAADMLPSSRITVWIRASARKELVPNAPRLGPFHDTPVDLRAIPEITGKAHMRIELELRTDDFEESPILKAVHVQYHCPSG